MKNAQRFSFLSASLVLLLTLLLLGAEPIFAAEVLRGPYLQSATTSSVIVRWRTDNQNESLVRYGMHPDLLQFKKHITVRTSEHVVKLTDLTPGTRYYYSVGGAANTLAGGPDYFFETHPTPGVAKPVRIWAIGDSGTFGTGFGNQIGVRDAFYEMSRGRRADVWLALGDNAYYSGTDAEYQASFFNVYPTLLRNTVIWSTIGNHETYAAPGSQNIPYFDIFSFPTQGESGGVPSGTEKYYSFDYANIHFVCLDSEMSDRSVTSPMLTWLRADLEANTADWLIAFWHSPPYSKGSHDSDNVADGAGNMVFMRQNVVPLLESYGVDLVLSGHSHIYERSYLLDGHYGFSDTLVPAMLKDAGSGREGDTGPYIKPNTGPSGNEGAVYVVAGSAGWATFRTGFHPAMFYDALTCGSLVIDVNGDRLDAKYVRDTGAIDDYFTIIKGAPPETLRVSSFKVHQGHATITWKSVAGEAYRVERTTNLGTATWVPVSGRIVATGGTSTWSEPVPAEHKKNFYRVIGLPPEP